MKKNLDLILLGCSAFFGLLVFVFLALPFMKLGNASASGYDYLDKGGITVAFIFVILAFLVSACLCLATFLGKADKIPFANFIAIGAALFALVAFILFLCTKSIIAKDYSGVFDIGAGAILCAISALICAFGLCGYGLLKTMKK